MMEKALVIANDIKKTYQMNQENVHALNGLSFEIEEGELVVVIGPSGAGKTTFLNILGGMDILTEGMLMVDGDDISKYTKINLTKYRRDKIGFVFQFYNLMPNLTALENVELATEICKDALDPFETLVKVGLETKKNHFPSQLSGGEQQRVSIARALAKNPKILLCDEPTGALDYETGRNILQILQALSEEEKKTVIIVTHNNALKDMADKVIYMKNGMATRVVKNQQKKQIKDISW